MLGAILPSMAIAYRKPSLRAPYAHGNQTARLENLRTGLVLGHGARSACVLGTGAGGRTG